MLTQNESDINVRAKTITLSEEERYNKVCLHDFELSNDFLDMKTKVQMTKE